MSSLAAIRLFIFTWSVMMRLNLAYRKVVGTLIVSIVQVDIRFHPLGMAFKLAKSKSDLPILIYSYSLQTKALVLRQRSAEERSFS